MRPELINGIFVGLAMIAASASMVTVYQHFSPVEYADVIEVTAAVDHVSTPRQICARSQNDSGTATSYCYTVVEDAQIPAGYDVSYRLGAKRGTVRMDHRPGERIGVEDGELLTDDARFADNR